MAEVVLQGQVREHTGKKAKLSRWSGMIPGVFYSRGEQNVSIQVDKASLDAIVFTSEMHVIDLKLPDGAARKCIIKDVQFDPISDRPIHFDLQGLHEGEKLTLDIPVVITGGVPKGARDGGMLQHMVHKLKISCLPQDIPQRVEVDVSGLDINDFVHVSDLSLPNVTILENAETTLVGVIPPAIVKEAEPAPGAEESKEPEVVAKGKKPEEGAEGEAKAEAKSEK